MKILTLKNNCDWILKQQRLNIELTPDERRLFNSNRFLKIILGPMDFSESPYDEFIVETWNY